MYPQLTPFGSAGWPASPTPPAPSSQRWDHKCAAQSPALCVGAGDQAQVVRSAQHTPSPLPSPACVTRQNLLRPPLWPATEAGSAGLRGWPGLAVCNAPQVRLMGSQAEKLFVGVIKDLGPQALQTLKRQRARGAAVDFKELTREALDLQMETRTPTQPIMRLWKPSAYGVRVPCT